MPDGLRLRSNRQLVWKNVHFDRDDCEREWPPSKQSETEQERRSNAEKPAEPTSQSHAANPDTPDEHETAQDKPGPQTGAAVDATHSDAREAEHNALDEPATPTLTPAHGTIGAESRCQQWLEDLMRAGSKTKPKSKYRTDAEQFGVGTRAFDRAWTNAIRATGSDQWASPGRIS